MPPTRKIIAQPAYDPSNPLIVQSDRSILVEVDNPRYAEARDALAPFAELEKSPEHIHTYRITNLSLWNAAAAGFTAESMVEVLQKFTKFPMPDNLPADIEEIVSRYGRIRLEQLDENRLRLVCIDKPLLEELARQAKVQALLGDKIDGDSFLVEPGNRGVLKQALIAVGYPAEDLAGYAEGTPLPIHLREVRKAACRLSCAIISGTRPTFSCRRRRPRRQRRHRAAVRGRQDHRRHRRHGPHAEVHAGADHQHHRRQAVDPRDSRQDRSDGQRSGRIHRRIKNIAAVTVATYQILTYRPDKKEEFPHFKLFDERDWGLIIYDEVHLLPAPVFRVTAQIQARRRLGLTATLIREDGREEDVFSLIGPKKYDVPWRELESRGWIAEANCTEVRVALPEPLRMEYAVAEWRDKYRIASENPAKEDIVAKLLEQYDGQAGADHRPISQAAAALLKKRFDIPLITGQTRQHGTRGSVRQIPPRRDRGI